jgi:hypothetical protein
MRFSEQGFKQVGKKSKGSDRNEGGQCRPMVEKVSVRSVGEHGWIFARVNCSWKDADFADGLQINTLLSGIEETLCC